MRRPRPPRWGLSVFVLRLVYSNYFEQLVDAVTADVRAGRERRQADIFSRVQIVVPNRNVSAYIKLAAARRLGVAAGYSFPFLKDFIAGLVPDGRRRYLRMLDIPHLQVLLMSALSDPEVLAREHMEPVVAYLHAGGDDPDAIEVRRIQLADKLATLFSDYSLSRPAMVAMWREQCLLEDTPLAATERWQRQLWLAIFARGARGAARADGADGEAEVEGEVEGEAGGLLEQIYARTKVSWRLPAPLFSRLTRDADAVAELALPPDVYVVGFSYVPRAYQRVFARLAELTRLYVYALNPCMEFWEDLRSGWEHRLAGRELARRDAERGRSEAALSPALDDADDTPALRLWGRPGRENIRMLNELTECDFEARFVDPTESAESAEPAEQSAAVVSDARTLATPATPATTTLRALQRDILFRHPERTEANAADAVTIDIPPGDDSVRVLGCPSPQRELEVVGNEIWKLVRADATLRFNDIAVLISRADQDRYQAHIASVFGELYDIPHHVVDMPLRAESRAIEALEMLLALPFGRFARPELLRLLTHPSVLARYPDVDPDDWIRWTERLGIVHGADHGDHAGTYIERDLFNWQQGIRRLALGAFMAGERSGEARAIEFGGTAYLPEELPTDAHASAARLSLLVRSLIGDARFCREARLPLAEWRVFLELMVSSYLAPTGEQDERNLAQCRAAIESLADHDLDGRPVPYRVAAELLRARLDGLRGQTGEYLAHGVTIAPLLPMRPLPYRAVFMVGLGEGRFPAAERESPIDLRAARRRRGDVGPRERDRYVFLETLLGARERLYLSYVSRDDQTGERLEPSSIVLELERMLRRGYRPAGHDEPVRLEVHHPLRRYDARYFPALYGHAGHEAFANAEQPGLPGVDEAGEASESALSDSRTAAPAAEPSSWLVSAAPAAHRQASALALRRHLERELRTRGRAVPSPGELRRALRSPRFAALRAQLGLDVVDDLEAQATGGADTAGETGEVVSVSLAMVRRFLECPLQAWAAAVLRLREQDELHEDLIARADEVWATPVGPMVGMLRAVIAGHLAGDARHLAALLARYRDRADRAELSGGAPTGVFSDVERERHQRILSRWFEHIVRLSDSGEPGGPERFVTHSFGRAREDAEVGSLLPPIIVTARVPRAGESRESDDGPSIRAELHGRTEPVGARLGSLVLAHGGKPQPKHLIRGFVDQLALSAAGVAADRPHMTTIVTGGDKTRQCRLGAWSQADAAAHLAMLVGEMLGQTHEYLLPCEAVFERRDKPDQSVAAIVEGYKVRGAGFSSLYGPIAKIAGLLAPREADAVIARRFGPLLERLEEIGGTRA